MPGAESIDVVAAAKALALDELGYNPAQIARQTQLKRASVDDILAGHGHWGEVAELPVFQRLRTEQQRYLEAGFRTASAQLLARALDESKLEKASTYQLVIASGIALDKSRLLAGESTANVEIRTTIELAGLDQLAEALSRRIVAAPVEDAVLVNQTPDNLIK